MSEDQQIDIAERVLSIVVVVSGTIVILSLAALVTICLYLYVKNH